MALQPFNGTINTVWTRYPMNSPSSSSSGKEEGKEQEIEECSSSRTSSSSSETSEGEKEKQAIEKDLKFKLKRSIENIALFDPDNFDNVDYDQISEHVRWLDCRGLVRVVTEFAGNEARVKAESAYRWVVAGEQYFLATDKMLGKGGYAKVYQGFTHCGKPCAIKMGDIDRKEVEYLKQFSSSSSGASNISQILAADHEEGFVVLELAHTSLSKAHQLSLREKEKRIVMRGILSGLEEIARKAIIHSDVKPRNILLMQRDGYFSAKISDFGLSIRFGDKFIGGTRSYYPPELFYYFAEGRALPKDEMHKFDVWAAMLVFGEFAYGLLSREFQDRCDDYEKGVNDAIKQDTREKDSLRMVEFLNNCFFDCTGLFSDLKAITPLDHLMQAMSVFNPRDRISAQEALKLFDGLFTGRPSPAPEFHFEELESVSHPGFHFEELDSLDEGSPSSYWREAELDPFPNPTHSSKGKEEESKSEEKEGSFCIPEPVFLGEVGSEFLLLKEDLDNYLPICNLGESDETEQKYAAAKEKSVLQGFSSIDIGTPEAKAASHDLKKAEPTFNDGFSGDELDPEGSFKASEDQMKRASDWELGQRGQGPLAMKQESRSL